MTTGELEVHDARADEVPGDGMPADVGPTGRAPTVEVPADVGPADVGPADGAGGGTAPAVGAPADGAGGGTAPAVGGPGVGGPADGGPGGTERGVWGPAESAEVGTAPTVGAPAVGTPAVGASAGKAPARRVSAGEPQEAYAAALAALPGMGPARLAAILRQAAPAEMWRRVLSGEVAQSVRSLRLPGLGAAPSWADVAARRDVRRRWASIAAAGIHATYLGGPGFPDAFADDPQPP